MAMLAGPLRALDCRIRPAVAWITKRDQVPQVVSIPVAVEAIQAEGAKASDGRALIVAYWQAREQYFPRPCFARDAIGVKAEPQCSHAASTRAV